MPATSARARKKLNLIKRFFASKSDAQCKQGCFALQSSVEQTNFSITIMKLYNRGFLIYLFALLLSFSFAVQAQQTQMKTAVSTVENYKLSSKLMAREMPYRVVLPTDYNSPPAKKTYPVIYLLHGLTGHFDNWTDKTKLAEYAAKYNYIIVTPEGDDGWYTDSASLPNDKYESYIAQELIPEIERKFRAIPDREHRAIAGLSMGGYGSLKFGLKYPEKFVLVGSFSGAVMAATLTQKQAETTKWQALIDSIKNTYGADDSPTRKANDVFGIVREMPADKLKTLPFMYISCGTEDGLIVTNHDFSNLLLEKKIPHEFRELPGIHDWKFWDAQIQEFLRASEKFIK